MKISEIYLKYNDFPVDRTLERDLEMTVKLKFVPDEYLCGKPILLEDETGILEAVSRANLFESLKKEVGKVLKLKGRLDKTEFNTIGFEIQEILE